MSSRKEKAAQLHAMGNNCAQAVTLAFADRVEVSEAALKAMATGFGAGGGDMNGTCGAVSACYLISSLIHNLNTADPSGKSKTMALNRQVSAAFLKRNGSVICKELKGIESGKPLRSCRGCVEDAAEILEELLEQ